MININTNQKVNQNTYNENSISVLEGLEAVRKRPGMYIGSTGKNGLHHCVYEIVDNSIDEAVNGSCDTINVIINNNNSVTVSDNGRGIPCGIHSQKGISTLEVVLSTLHAGGKFGQGGYKTSGGLHGVGASVVNALSIEFETTVHRDGNIYQQHYSKGKKIDEVTVIGKSDKTGTKITFKPDDTIFTETIFDYNTLTKRLKELAFLNKKITIVFEDKRTGKEQIQFFHYEGGLKEFITYLNENKDKIEDNIIYIEKEQNNCQIEIAFQYTNNYNENLYSFVNNIHTIEGGYHVNGFYNGLTKMFNEFVLKNNYLKEKDDNFQKEDIKEGLTSIISIKISEPEFEGQTKTKLGNTYVQSVVSNVIKEYMEIYCTENKKDLEKIIDKILISQKSRLAAKKAKELNRKKGKTTQVISSSKIALCSSKDMKICEFIVVEGDSAGGSAKQARNRCTQTIMCSKGKIMNVEKQKEENVLASEELKLFSDAIGTGMGENFNIENLKYNFILLLQDADTDGGHIGTLWLTYIYRYMKGLIEKGHVYFCVPPLYRNTISKEHNYTYSEEEQKNFLEEHKNEKNIETQRYKGLGEQDPQQLWETTLDPETRTLLQVTMEDAVEAERIITLLMGDKVPPRKEFIKNNSKIITSLDI